MAVALEVVKNLPEEDSAEAAEDSRVPCEKLVDELCNSLVREVSVELDGAPQSLAEEPAEEVGVVTQRLVVVQPGTEIAPEVS